MTLRIFILLFLIPFISHAEDFYDLGKRPALKYPIVLVHGASLGGARLLVGPIDLGKYFQGIPEYLGKGGTTVHVVELPTDATIAERAYALKQYLETDLKGVPVNLVAHSLGGLDARYLVSVLKYNNVKSITTIATPHRGSPLANWAMNQIATNGIWYNLFKLLGYDFNGRRFLPQLTTDYMQNAFNPRVLDRPDVKYFSVVSTINYKFAMPSLVIIFPKFFLDRQNSPMAKEPNDGLVPKSSQPWGPVIHEALLDHMGEINHHFLRWPPKTSESLTIYFQIYQKLLDEGL